MSEGWLVLFSELKIVGALKVVSLIHPVLSSSLVFLLMVLPAFDDYFPDVLFHLELQRGDFLILSFLMQLLTGILL